MMQDDCSFREDDEIDIDRGKNLKVNYTLIQRLEKQAKNRDRINQNLVVKQQKIKLQTFKNNKKISEKQTQQEIKRRQIEAKRDEKAKIMLAKKRDKIKKREEKIRMKQQVKQKPLWLETEKKQRRTTLIKQSRTIDARIASQLMDAFNRQNAQTSQVIAMRLGISTGRVQKARKEFETTGNIVLSVVENKQRANSSKDQYRAKVIIMDMLKTSNCIQLKDMKLALTQRMIDLPEYKIGDMLHIEGYQYRRLDQALNYNSEQILKKRREFAQKIDRIKNQNLYFLAQTRFHLKLHERYGWVKKDQQYHGGIPFNSECRNVIALLGPKGLMKYVIIDPVDGWEILNLKEDIRKQLQKLKEDDHLIVENPITKTAREVLYSCSEKKFNVQEISEYSFQMNPLKLLFSKIKTKFVKMRQQGLLRNTQDVRQKLTLLFQPAMKNLDGPVIYQKMRYFVETALKKQNFDQFL